jgi:hypothetical protein
MTNQKEIEPVIVKRILLSALLALVLLIMGCTTSAGLVKTTEPPISPIPRPATTAIANPRDVQAQLQRLRITNQSPLPMSGLVVIFPNERIELGDVPAGATTGYKEFSHGVYRYAAYNVEVNGKQYEQPVVDWIGEFPMQGAAFTYILEADPARWTTEGQVIRLVKVIEDQTP